MITENSKKANVYSTANGFPYLHHPYGAMYSKPNGSLLLRDAHLIESLAHFDRERTPERVVHAKGGGCRFEFELTDSLSDLTIAAPYQEVGYKCPGIVRFSTVGGETASPDTARDPRGVSWKFYTKWGNHDWVFNNTPVFFIRDPNKFPHFIHTQKRFPQNNLGQSFDTSMYWDYLTQNLESIHQITYMFGDRGTPASWGEMNSYSGHTFKFVNKDGIFTYVQYHILADAGFKTLSNEEAAKLAGESPDYNQASLFTDLNNGKHPTYTCYIQTMTSEQAANFKYSINDLTKVWPHKDFPLRRFGKITLTENVGNYFSEIEQVAFSPSNTCIPGIDPSNDPVLQSRLFSYQDTQRHRLGTNYQQLPVNRPNNLVCPFTGKSYAGECPFNAVNFQKNGPMCFDNYGSNSNYISSFDRNIEFISNPCDIVREKSSNPSHSLFEGIVLDEQTKKHVEDEICVRLKQQAVIESKIDEVFYVSGVSQLDLEQPRRLYEKVYNEEDKKTFVKNVVSHASRISKEYIKVRVAQYFGLLNQDLGKAIAEGLNVEWEPITFGKYVESIGLVETI